MLFRSENNPSQPIADAIYSVDGSMSMKERIIAICKKIYRAAVVEFSSQADKMIIKIEEDKFYENFPVCVAKTQFSFTDNAKVYGNPEGFTIKIREIVVNRGAGFIVAIAGDMMRMPGLPKNPSATLIDLVDGKITGLS